MRFKKKIVIAALVVLAITLLGGVIFILKSFRSATTFTHETPQGQRSITLPAIPGMEKVSEEKGECFQETSYIFTATKMDIGSEIKDRLKSTFAERGWKQETVWDEDPMTISFTTTEQGELERINLQVGFEESKGTSLTLEYQWPPCSEEKVKGVQSAAGGWPMFHGNTARTGFSDSKVPSKPNVLWQATVGGNWLVIADDKVFFADEEQVFALSLSKGEILWQYRDPNNSNFFPHGSAVGNGKIFVTINDTDNLQTMKTGHVYALDVETGKFLWKTQIAKDPSHSLPLVAEGKVFVGDDSGTLNALDAETGKILWQKKLVGDGEIHSSPAYDQGLIFIGTEGDARYTLSPKNPSSVFALQPTTGEIVWQFPIDYTSSGTNLIHSTPAVADGVVYVGSENGWFYALKAVNGQLIWKKELASGREMVGSSAAAGLGYGKIFVSLWSGKFLALDQKSGETVWEFSYEGNGTDSSPVVADNKVCAGAHGGHFYCLDAETGRVLWQEKLGGASAALANRVLIVINADGGLVALSDESQAALDLPTAKVSESKIYLLMIFAGTGILLALGGLLFFRRRKR